MEVVAKWCLPFFKEHKLRLPTPQGPFWTRKTHACSVGGVVAHYKDAGMGWSTFFLNAGGYRKVMNKAIGIDPDSNGYICCLVDVKEAHGKKMGYLTTLRDLESLVRWVKKEGTPIVAIEGSNGISKPVEEAFRKEQIVFHSLRPSNVSKFRKVVLGKNKNNEKDAESVARYALALQAHGKLEQFRRVWFPDESLRLLTRGYERKSKELTAELNRMWKLLRLASPDLYLALKGSNPEVEISNNGLKIQGVLSLLEQKPDILEWKGLSAEDFRAAMGGGDYRGRQRLIDELQRLSEAFSPTPPAVSLMIRSSAQTILQAKRQLSEMKKLIREITAENTAVSRASLNVLWINSPL